jgi:hypothetical protein|tara:strand:- start:1132 stop:1269 length:138 start_codon:yes stop_codon:yes gene_type:complete
MLSFIYINLGMSDPYRDFEDFREYAKQVILQCEINGVTDGGELFE